MPAPLSYPRAMAMDQEVLHNYLTYWREDTLKANGIFNDPPRIFNCDETGMPLSPTSSKVVDKVGSKNTSCLTGSINSQVTVLACSCTTGYVIPPFVIFDRQALNPELTNDEIPGTLYGLSSNGWIDKDLFSDHFSCLCTELQTVTFTLRWTLITLLPGSDKDGSQSGNNCIYITSQHHTYHTVP